MRIKWIIATTFVLVLSTIVVSAINYAHLEASNYNESAQRLREMSHKIQERARPEYGNETLKALPPNVHIGPFYRLDDRVEEAKVLAEPIRPEGLEASDTIFSYDFDEEGGLHSAKGRSSLEWQDGTLVIQQDETDYLINQEPIEIPKDQVGEIIIRAKAEKGKYMRLAWGKEDQLPKRWSWANRSLDIPISADNKFHTYFINAANVLRRNLETGDIIRTLLLKPSDRDGDRVEIDFIRFISKHSKYIRSPRGVTYETVAKEMRQVLYMLPAQTLDYGLTVPKKSPTLDFGCAVLFEGKPIQFTVTITDGQETISLHNQSIATTSQWHDVRLNLEPWAGKEIRLSIAVDGSKDNVALWSNPIVFSQTKKPFNIIILIEDALRGDHLSTYGYKLPTSPGKDRLSEKSMVFLNAISQATKTRPSVPSMMTSLMPTATGVWHWADVLNNAYLTLAEIMRSQGFSTASFIQNGNVGPYAGLHQGFSTLVDYELWGAETESLLGTHVMTWLDRNRDRNFFLYLHVADPHGQYDPPSPYDAWYQELAPGKTPQEPRKSVDPDWVNKPTVEGRRSLYDGEILHNDTIISGFIEKLKKLGIYEQTLLILTSDHGEHLGERGDWEHHPPGYLNVTHVPLMLVYPEQYKQGQKIEERVQLLDVMPTVLELAQVERQHFLLQGDSLVDLIEGGGQTDWRNRIVVSEEPMEMDKSRPWHNKGLFVRGSLYYRNWHMITSRSFWGTLGNFVPEIVKLKVFNVSTDPEESRPLYSFFPDLYFRYTHASLLTHLQENNIESWKKLIAFGQEQSYRFDPDVLEHLKALGYVE